MSLPGFQANAVTYMAASTLFVLSSAWEGLPTVLIEALAAGTRVVSTDCPSGPREILDGGRWGKLVPMGDAEALAAGILQSLEGARGRPDSAWLERYSSDSVLDRYERILGVREPAPFRS